MGLKPCLRRGLFLVFLLTVASCTTDPLSVDDEGSPAKSFDFVKELYKNGVYKRAIEEGERYKTKYSYNKFFSEVDLLVAESYFHEEEYLEAAVHFKRFSQYYPDHPKRAYALYKIGDTYWQQAPTTVDREQAFAKKAIKAWELVLKSYPQSPIATKVKELIKEGQLRHLKSDQFIAGFYCKQKIWHACAYKSLQRVNQTLGQREIQKDLLQKSAKAIYQLALQKTEKK